MYHKHIYIATAAGHVLGAAMFTIEIDGIRVLYTGDYSMEEDRHLAMAEVPAGGSPDVLIVESTFGVQALPSQEEREERFTTAVADIVTRGGNCLIPVFALGRAQELLLILEEFWQENPELQNIKVFYASKMASKALKVYQTFVHMMNKHITDLTDVSNPFQFNYVRALLNDGLNDDVDVLNGPSVVMASPGFLENGVSRRLFERWCEDATNGVIIAGYTVEGTLAHTLLSSPNEVMCMDNRMKPRRCTIDHVSFSAHVDYVQNLKFIRTVLPDNIILVHGEKKQMARLRDELDKEISKNWPSKDGHKPPVVGPANGMSIKIKFQKLIEANIVGKASLELLNGLETSREAISTRNAHAITKSQTASATIPPKIVLVSENFISKVVDASELHEHTSCRLGVITQRIHVPIPIGYMKSNGSSKSVKEKSMILSTVMPYVDDVMDLVEWVWDADRNSYCLLVREVVKIIENKTSNSLVVEWLASPAVDMIADCVVGTLYQALSVPAMLRNTTGNNASSGVGMMPDSAPVKVENGSKRSQSEMKRNVEDPMNGTNTGVSSTLNVVKKMKLGLINPKNALNSSIINDVLIEASTRAPMGKEEIDKCNHDHKHKNQNVTPKDTYIQRLLNMQELLSKHQTEIPSDKETSPSFKKNTFATVKLNKTKTCIILRSHEVRSDEDVSDTCFYHTDEGYVFFHFNRSNNGSEHALHEHHAVVQSDSDAFRKLIIDVLKDMNVD